MITLALYNLKGGVGKTTTAVNLAWLASEAKKRTVLWDWDPQAAASWYCGLDVNTLPAIKLLRGDAPVGTLRRATPYDRLTVIPADLSLRKTDTELAGVDGARKLLRKMSLPLSEDVSILIFDCPPSLSPSMDYLLSAVDVLLLPMIPSPLSLRAMEQVLDFFAAKKKAPKHIYGFFNMVDLRRTLHKDTLAQAKALPLPILKTWVPMDSAAERMAVLRQPLPSYAKNGRAAQAYRNMWRELTAIIKKDLKAIP